jgi:hypothetical protein
MQFYAGIGAKPYDVAGVRWNFRLIENDVEHGYVFGAGDYC